jgi:hypothetical protein
MPDAGGVGTAGTGGTKVVGVCETGGTYTVFVTLGVQDVEAGFSPNSPPGLTDELKCAGTAVLVLVPTDGLTGAGVTELAGALETGPGSGAAEEEGVAGAALDGAGAGAWLEGAGAGA